MQIETYEIEEMKSSEATTMAVDAEAMELVEKLGLSGQKKLSNTNTMTRFPYPRVTAKQLAVFSTLFPSHILAEDYAQGIIPLRVLQVIAYCRDFKQCSRLEIWHSATVREDPVLIGSPTQYSSEQYLLARWGNSLASLDDLAAKALPLIVAKFRSEAAAAVHRLNGYVERAEDLARVYLETGDKPTWNVYD